MGIAYEMTLISLRLVDRGDIVNNVVAQKLIEIAKAGERDPERLCEAVLQQWDRPIAHVSPPISPAEFGSVVKSTATMLASLPETRLPALVLGAPRAKKTTSRAWLSLRARTPTVATISTSNSNSL
jgi:hypothetical protein